MTNRALSKVFDKICNIQNSQYDIEKTLVKLENLKVAALEKNQQEKAAHIWCTKEAILVHKSYLSAFSNLKKQKFYDAWCDLEIAEKALWGIKAPKKYLPDNWQKIWIQGKYDFIEQHVEQWQALYPYKLFLSTEEVYKEFCSVCSQEINPRKLCGHHDGEIYNGEMRMRVRKDIKILAVALVENPARRFSVPFITDKITGEKIDQYDYKLVKYLISALDSPFQAWSYEITYIDRDFNYFKQWGITLNDTCPCQSGKSYGSCCVNTTVSCPHFQFTIST